MKILVTGANGFMGQAFMACLEKTPHEFRGLVRTRASNNAEITNYDVASLVQIFKTFQPDLILHAAGTASVALSISDPQLDHSSSIGLAENLIAAAESYRATGAVAPKFCYVSTAAIYGNPEKMPVREQDTPAPISPYGVNRLKCEKLFLNYGLRNSAAIVIARAFSVFGPNQRRLVLWEMANQALRKDKIVVQGTGEEMRDFIPVEEFATKCVKVMEAHHVGNLVINVASGESRTIDQLVNTLLEKTGRTVPVERKNQAHPGNPDRWEASVDLYRRITGDTSIPNFDEALKRCLDIWKKD